jgi:hypothetical protein
VIFQDKVKALLRSVVSKRQWRLMKSFLCPMKIFFYRNNLSKLALVYGSDKQGSHCYTQHYQCHFEALRREELNILEIGIGGYKDPKAGGASLRMWKAYFPKSRVLGIDIYDKTYHDEERIKTFQGSQTDPDFLKRVVEEIGPVDIIIDDGSHYNDHVITSFKILFPLLAPKGIYVVEDTQTSYWSSLAGVEWGGSSDLTAPYTSMTFFKSLIDGMNYEEFTLDGYTPSYFDKHIIAMHFYHNLIFIYKGLNNEGSNREAILRRRSRKVTQQVVRADLQQYR